MSLSRPEFEREVPPIVVSQRNISTRDLCFGSPVLSLSEDTRAYFIIVDYMTMKPCIEIQNLKDDWKVRIEDPISMTLMALSPEGDLITASPKGGLARWKNISPQQKPEPEAIVLKSPPESSIRCMQFKPTGELICGYANGSILSWDLKTGISEFFGKVRLVEEIEIDRYGNLTCKQSCSVADAHDVICFDKNNKLVGSIKSPGELTALAVRLDEGQLATANDTSIFIWNIKTQKLIASLKTKFGVHSLSLSPDGLLVATEMYGLIEFFDPVAAYKNVASIDLPDMGATGVSAYWNDYGYLTGIGLDRIVDIKCEIKKQLVIRCHLL